MEKISHFGDRLKEERLKLGLKVADFIAITGADRKTISNYEANRTSPTAAFLAAVSDAGVDVLYIVTGKRNPVIAEQRGEYCVVSKQDQLFLENFSHCPEDVKGAIRRLAQASYVANDIQETKSG